MLRRLIGLFALGLLLVASPSRLHSQPAPGDALFFFKNYFLTGDYVVAGVGLRGLGGPSASRPGFATNRITINIPNDPEVVAAFLYWQVVSKNSAALGPDSGAVDAMFNGFLLSTADGPVSKVLVRDGTAACWSAGGGTGGGGTIKTYTYRADVRRFLVNENGRIGNNGIGSYEVQVPDSGPSGNQVPIALGASLVVIYRDTSKPLNAVVLYDGGFTVDQSHDSMSQTIRGFYQAAGASNITGRITHIVGSGQLNKLETLHLPGTVNGTALTDITNPFRSFAGESWDNPTYDLNHVNVSSSPPQYGDSVTTSVDRAGLSTSSFDCLSWGAIIYRTAVVDTDGDGLLDFWEEAGTHSDPNGHVLPDLYDMGARDNQKDLFVEFGYMYAPDGTKYGGQSKPEHKHMPVAGALKNAGDGYKNRGIKAHFDVGDITAYHALGPEYNSDVGDGTVPDNYLVLSEHARGGEAISESVTVTTPDGDPCASPDCQFPDYPGTVGWKVGFKFYRDQLLRSSTSEPPLPLLDPVTGDDPCDVESVAPGNDDGLRGRCERRFDRNRKDMFRYVLGAHFVGLPQSEFPCVDGSGKAVAAGADGLCAVDDNPSFHIPRTVSGTGDFPGADVLLTLGGFADAAGKPVGSSFMQGSTLMHELGHNFDLSHAGIYLGAVTPEPNCKPNYLSVMNYLFQLRGLFKLKTAQTDPDDNVPRMDYSGEVLDAINENPVTNPFNFQNATPGYRTGWYAPKSDFTVGSAATKHCDGSTLSDAEKQAGREMVRVDGPSLVGALIDWNLGLSDTMSPQDVNFDGTQAALEPNTAGKSLKAGSNDWANLRLNQLGTRRNVLGLSADVGRDGLGRGETLGRDGLGRDGLGRDGLGRDGLGRDGLGRDGLGRDGLGRDGLGRDGLGRDGLGADEVDDNIAAASGYAPPNNLTAIVVGGTGDSCPGAPPATVLPPAQCHRIQLNWTVPNVGTVFQYLVKRHRTDDPAQTKTNVVGQPVRAVQGTLEYSLVDPQELLDATNYTYTVAAEFVDNDNNGQTPPPLSSRSVSITAVNIKPAANPDPPVASPNSYTINQGSSLVVTTSCAPLGKGVLCNDTDVDSPSLTAKIVTLPLSGTGTLTSNGTPLIVGSSFDGSFTYTPPSASFTGIVTFTYSGNDLDPSRSSSPAKVTITVKKKSGK
jgi:hypothetical protein